MATSTFGVDRRGRWLAMSLLLLAGCAAPPLGSNLGTRLEAEGLALRFAWQPDHPWAAQFQSQAPRYRLYAQYRSGGQPYEQDLGAARAGQGSVQFQLPTALRAPPDAAVCLFISPSRSAPAVPVREAKPGVDTARFRYAAWDSSVGNESRRSVAQNELARLEQAVAEQAADVDQQRKQLSASKLTSVADCQRLASVPAGTEPTPGDVVEPARQAEASQRVCVRRARNMRRYNEAYRLDMQQVVSRASADTQAPMPERSRAQATRFLQQWARWIDSTGADYTPEVGPPNEGLPTVGTLDDAIKAFNAAGANATAEARRTVAVGLLDSYAGCMEDVAKQLNIKYDAWQRARINKPQRDRLYAERQTAECRSRFAQLSETEAALADLRRRAAEKAAQVPGGAAGAALPAGKVGLNEQTCSL